MEELLKKIETWNEADEFSRCIQALEAVPEAERDFKLTVLLARAYSNLAVLGDRQEHGDDGVVDAELLSRALALLESVREAGEGDALWNSRMAYALYMTDRPVQEALDYAEKWLALDPENAAAQALVKDCKETLQHQHPCDGCWANENRARWGTCGEDRNGGADGDGGERLRLESRKYPHIFYKPGEELFLEPGTAGVPFWFDVSEELTENGTAIAAAASALDGVEETAERAKAFVKGVLADEGSEYHSIAAYFMEFHRDELGEDIARKLFSTENPAGLSYAEMTDCLRVNRFGSFLDAKTKEQRFIMDLSFNPELTDELLVIYLDLEGRIINISHES